MSDSEQSGLEIDQDLDFQEKSWRVQRIAWVIMLLVVVLALMGLFGTGWLSSATAGSQEDGLVLDYERFVRHGGEASLKISVSPDQVSEGQIELGISSAYMSDIELQQVSPQPSDVRSEGDRQVYVFLADNPDEPVEITFTFRPDDVGRLSGDIDIVDGPSVSFSQISYP